MRANVWICELVSVWMYVCACAFEYERYCLFKGEDVSIQISLVYREQISISSDKNSEYYTCLRASFFSFYGNFSLDVLFHRSLHWLLCFVYPGPVLDSLLVDYLYRCYWYWYCGSLSSTMKFPSYSFILFKHFFFRNWYLWILLFCQWPIVQSLCLFFRPIWIVFLMGSLFSIRQNAIYRDWNSDEIFF